MVSTSMGDLKHWRVNRAVELGAPSEAVWEVIGGFYTIHEWHPDIAMTEVPENQTSTRQLRRILTFPGQTKTTEELVSLDNANCEYRYEWYAGEWGEAVKNYHACLRVFSVGRGRTCIVQWASEFDFTSDAISDFYENGFRALLVQFPLGAAE